MQVHIQKVRFKHIGKVGLVDLVYDRVTGCYSETLRAVRDRADDYRQAKDERMREPGEDEIAA